MRNKEDTPELPNALTSRAYRYHRTKDDETARADLEEVLRRGGTKTVDLVYLCRELGLPGF